MPYRWFYFQRSGTPMGEKLSKHSSSKREAKALFCSNIRTSSKKSSIIETIKAGCLKKRKMTKKNGIKRPMQSPERRITEVRNLTLGDWLLASPGSAGLKPDCFNGGELYVFKHFSRKVHPSSSREGEAVLPSTTPRDSFSMDLSSADVSGSSFSRNQSGKLKKKVSFRLPEEADILIFHSQEETLWSD